MALINKDEAHNFQSAGREPKGPCLACGKGPNHVIHRDADPVPHRTGGHRFRELVGTPVCAACGKPSDHIDHLEAKMHERIAIDHPPHYDAHPSGVECIQITEHMGFNLGNVVKYVWRADLKGTAEDDLRKAAWYIARELKRRGYDA
jgi:Protein of unknwon function (DUF3310)